MAPPRFEIPADLEASIVLLRHGESTHIAEGRFQGQADSPLSALGERQAELAASRLAAPARPPAIPIPDRRPLEIVHSPLVRAARTAHLVADAVAAEAVAADAVAAEAVAAGAIVAGAIAAGAIAAGGSGAAGGSRAAGLPGLRPEPRLMEIAQGSWEGDLRADIEARDAALLAAWRSHPLGANAPGGERIVDAAVRVRAALADVVSRLAAAATAAEVGAVGVEEADPAVEDGAPAADRDARPAGQVSGYPRPSRDGAPWTLLVGHDGIFKVVLLTLLDIPLESFWAFPFALCGITVVEFHAGRGVLRAHNLVEHLASIAGPARDAQDAQAGGVRGADASTGRDRGGAL